MLRLVITIHDTLISIYPLTFSLFSSNQIIQVDAIPLTGNGKIDKALLSLIPQQVESVENRYSIRKRKNL